MDWAGLADQAATSANFVGAFVFTTVKNAFDSADFLVKLAAFLLLVLLIVLQASKSFFLLARFHKDAKCGEWWAVIGALLAISWNSFKPFDIRSWLPTSLYANTRRRLEHDIFHPRPKAVAASEALKAFLRDNKKALREGDGAALKSLRTLRNEDAESGLGAWRRSVRNAIKHGVVNVATPKQVNGAEESIIRYFDLVAGTEPRRREDCEFKTALSVADSFVAPLHLIAGLLHRVDDEWGEIIDIYNRDIANEAMNAPTLPWEHAIKALRTIQKFTFDCWLLWGPSIPICTNQCSRHAASLSSVQLGYGDENSSVEVIGHHAAIAEQIERLGSFRQESELAVNVSVRGWISHSNVFPGAKDVSKSIQTSWSVDDNGRVLLLLENGSGEKGAIEPKTTPSHYYTAYLWVCFVVLRDEGGAWRPRYHNEDAPSRSNRPWLDFMPFFEHGNIADGPTYRFLKRQLARKALAGFSRFAKEWTAANPGTPYPLKFAYACAVDDSGCGNDLKFTSADDMGDIRAALREMLPEYPELAQVVNLEAYAPSGHPHTSCEMPKAIETFYKYVQQVTEEA